MKLRTLVLLGALALSSVAAAATARTEEGTAVGPLARMDEAMLGVGAHVQNAKSGIKRGATGVAPEGTGSGYTSFAAGCCSSNIETIKTKMVAIQQDLKLVHRYYSQRQNATATNVTEQMDQRLREVAQAILDFARAPDKELALNALEGVVRPWNEFRNGIEILEGCCPIMEDPAAEAALTPPAEPSADPQD